MMTADQAYRRQAAQSVTPLHLVVALYEQLVADLRRALAAHQSGQIEARAHEIDHALVVLGYLQGTLDMDRGGEVAANLEQFYNLLRASLLRADPLTFPAVIDKQISNLLLLREAWAQLDAGLPPQIAHLPPQRVPSEEAPETVFIQDWKA